MRFTRDKHDFIGQMQDEFTSHNNTEVVSTPPTPDQVRQLFRYLRGRPAEAEDAFRSYASIFYMHIGNIQPSGGVTYPGGAGDACDNWAETRRHQAFGGVYIIDCEGFAVMGVALLREAGYRFVEYRIAFPSDRWFSNNHAIAVIRNPTTQATLFVGNADIYDSFAAAIDSVGWDPRTVRYGNGQTLQESEDEAYRMLLEQRCSMIGAAISEVPAAISRGWRRAYPWTHTPR